MIKILIAIWYGHGHIFSGHNVFPLIHINFIRVWNGDEIYALFGLFLFLFFGWKYGYTFIIKKKKALNIFLEGKLQNIVDK